MKTLLYGISTWDLGIGVSILEFSSEGCDERDSGLAVTVDTVPRLDLRKLSGTGGCYQALLLCLSQGP